MKRREFITLLGGAAAWPLAARAQQPAMPVIGFLGSSAPVDRARYLTAFRQGLREPGYVEGQNVAIEYRWAQDQADRLPDLAADLVRRQVTVIAAHDTPSSIVAKAATTTIPIVFASGGDPVKLGLVASLNRPGGNVTGVTFVVAELGAKQLGLLHELQPGAVRVGVLVDPNFAFTQSFVSDVQAAALSIGKQIEVLEAPTGRDIDTAFARLAQKPIDALLVGPGPLLDNRRVQLATLAAYHRVPAIYPLRDLCRSRRSDELRNKHHRRISPGRRVHRPDSQGREARRPTGHAVDQIRVRDQPQHRQGIRPQLSARAARQLPTR